MVTPYAGVWIEIQRHLPYSLERMSLPTRECGLKYYAGAITKIPPRVTPYAGVWIEIPPHKRFSARVLVTPYAGVWIEM